MERLTRKKLGNTDGKEFVLCNRREDDCDDSCQYGTCEWSRKALLKLKEYEDLEDQGLLLKLPCKVGTTVYSLNRLLNGKTVIGELEADAFFIALCAMEDKFGKTVFLTQAEAEEALKSMKGSESGKEHYTLSVQEVLKKEGCQNEKINKNK